MSDWPERDGKAVLFWYGKKGVLQGPTLQQSIQELMSFAARPPINVPDPIYGNASIDDIAKVRLGAMGIF